jgi:hypothetical protein
VHPHEICRFATAAGALFWWPGRETPAEVVTRRPAGAVDALE